MKEGPLLQYGVIACRAGEGGATEILLITSRDTRRWVVPRGNPVPGLSPAQSAVLEAWEEAGVRGAIMGGEIGAYRYEKRRRDGSMAPARVHLFLLAVNEELDDWPEREMRERRWLPPEQAAQAVDEPDLKALILSAPQWLAGGATLC
jgi:8-oxo-dGTP pyrophosphatase MutT (NUDIX family)